MIRPFQPNDGEEVATLLCQCPELSNTTADAFRHFAAQSFNQQARDFRVKTDDQGAIVGLLTSTLIDDKRLRHFRIVVAPEHRGRGHAQGLFEALCQQERPDASALQCNSQDSWREGNTFLEARGFHLHSRELLMERGSGDIRDWRVPSGYQLRAYEAQDQQAWQHLHRQAYQHEEDFSEVTDDDAGSESRQAGFAMWVVEHEDEARVVGYCHTLALELDASKQATRQLINSLVVEDGHQRRGLARALVSAALWGCAGSASSRLATDAEHTDVPLRFELNVRAQNHRAIELYQRVGFRAYDSIRCYRRARHQEQPSACL